MGHFIPRLGRTVPIVIAARALTGAAGTVVRGVTISKSGKAVTAVRTVTESTLATTRSVAWGDIPGMSTTINVPANQRALLIITFSAETNCVPDFSSGRASCLLRVLVDDAPVSPGQ